MDQTNIRIREHFGLVSNDTQTKQFHFLISPPKNRPTPQKKDYILIDHPNHGDTCPILATITEVTSFEEVAASTISDRMGKTQAAATILGYVDLRNEAKPIREVLSPPNSGCRVYVPLQSFLEDLLNRNQRGEKFAAPFQIGVFDGTTSESQEKQKIKCYVDLAEVASKHSLIAGAAQTGKTRLAKKLAKAVAEKNLARVVVFDFYGEYQDEADNQIALTADKCSFTAEALQKSLEKGKVTSLNAAALTPQEKQACFSNALSALLKFARNKKTQPIMVVVEEAHKLGGALEENLDEAGKLGVALVLVTSSPSGLAGSVHSKVSSQIVGKTVNPSDAACLVNLAGGVDLASLMLEEWVVAGVKRWRPFKACPE